MQATIFGETHKIFFGNKSVKDFLEKEKEIFKSVIDNKNTFYNKDTLVCDPSINYLNILPENSHNESLKNIILSEYYRCENIYPSLGDYFLFKLFDQKIKINKLYRFRKSNEFNFLKTLSDEVVASLTKWLFDNISLKRSINISYYLVIVKKVNIILVLVKKKII